MDKGDLRVVDIELLFSLLGEKEKYGHSGVLYIPSRFVVERNETSSKITGDRDFALVYYLDWFLSRLNVSHHSNRIAGNALVVIEWAAFSFCTVLLPTLFFSSLPSFHKMKWGMGYVYGHLQQ
jgi:hypothetical protein